MFRCTYFLEIGFISECPESLIEVDEDAGMFYGDYLTLRYLEYRSADWLVLQIIYLVRTLRTTYVFEFHHGDCLLVFVERQSKNANGGRA